MFKLLIHATLNRPPVIDGVEYPELNTITNSHEGHVVLCGVGVIGYDLNDSCWLVFDPIDGGAIGPYATYSDAQEGWAQHVHYNYG